MKKDHQERDGAEEIDVTSGHAEPAVQTEEPAETLRAQLEEAQAEAQENFNKYQRAIADFQNYKRRTEEQRADYRRDANAALVINILPAIDDLDRALASVDAKLAGLQWIEGIRQIQRKFQGALTALDVTEIEADGVDFDPRLHEAVGHVPGDEGKVVQVLQKGYTVGDRVVRPAMVMVGNGETGQ
jgi:molecular chaperone GrpE